MQFQLIWKKSVWNLLVVPIFSGIFIIMILLFYPFLFYLKFLWNTCDKNVWGKGRFICSYNDWFDNYLVKETKEYIVLDKFSLRDFLNPYEVAAMMNSSLYDLLNKVKKKT